MIFNGSESASIRDFAHEYKLSAVLIKLFCILMIKFNAYNAAIGNKNIAPRAITTEFNMLNEAINRFSMSKTAIKQI